LPPLTHDYYFYLRDHFALDSHMILYGLGSTFWQCCSLAFVLGLKFL